MRDHEGRVHGWARRILCLSLSMAACSRDASLLGGSRAKNGATTLTLQAPRLGHTLSALGNDRALVVGGEANFVSVLPTEILDVAAGTSTVGPSLLAGRSGHTATALADGRVVVLGGTGQSSQPVEIIDVV